MGGQATRDETGWVGKGDQMGGRRDGCDGERRDGETRWERRDGWETRWEGDRRDGRVMRRVGDETRRDEKEQDKTRKNENETRNENETSEKK